MATKEDVVEALRTHFATSVGAPTMETLAAHLGSTPGAVRQHLKVLRGEGVVTWEPRDFTTLKFVSSQAKVKPAKRASKPAPSAGAEADDLETSISVTYSAAEIEKLKDLHAGLGELIATLEATPPLGRDGAYLMRLLAKVHGG